MMHLVVAAVFEGVCGREPRSVAYEGALVPITQPEGFVALRVIDGGVSVHRLDPMARATQPPQRWSDASASGDAVVAGDLVITRNSGLRAYDFASGALRWSVDLSGASGGANNVVIAYDPQHGELGVVWEAEYPIDPERPGYVYSTIQFARLDLRGRWIDPQPVDVTPRNPRRAASLGHQSPLRMLAWTGAAYRFVYWQSDRGDGDHGTLRLGALTRDGRLQSVALAAEPVVAIRWADGPPGTAVVWTTVIDGRPVLRARLPGVGQRPFTLDRNGSSGQVAWHGGGYFVAWDHGPQQPSAADRTSVRLGRLDAARGAIDVREAPLDLSADQWPDTRGLYATACGLVVHTVATSARTSLPWMWFVPGARPVLRRTGRR